MRECSSCGVGWSGGRSDVGAETCKARSLFHLVEGTAPRGRPFRIDCSAQRRFHAAISCRLDNPDLPESFRRHSRSARWQLGGARWSRLAFTLVELMIVVAIIGTLAGIAIPAFQRTIQRSKVQRAIVDIKAISTDIEAYELENGRVPDSLAEIDRDGTKDPWGNPYQYLSFAAIGPSWKGHARKDHSQVPLNSTYDLYSMGEDGDTAGPLTARASRDDIVRAHDGGFVGLGADF